MNVYKHNYCADEIKKLEELYPEKTIYEREDDIQYAFGHTLISLFVLIKL